MSANNLLVSLHRYASRQDENFVTEAFAHLLRRLLEHEPRVAGRVLEKLTAGALPANAERAPAITVKTQVTTDQGRPDIEIAGLGVLIYVEAKVESELGDRQLERYLEELDAKTGVASRALVLLTRYPVDVPDAIASSVTPRRWYQVGDWLIAELGNGAISHAVSRHIAAQFVDFLTHRGIMMDAVRWELVDGVRSFRSLVGMLLEAVAALKIPVYQKTSAWDSIGIYLDGKNYWVGFNYDRPELLVFMTFLLPIASDAAEKAGFGRVQPESYSPTKTKWVHELVLDSEDVHFFARSRASQMQCIEKFLDDSIKAAQRTRLEATEA